MAERLNNPRARFAIEGFQDATFVEYDAAERRWIEVRQHLVICDIDAFPDIGLVAANGNVDAELLALPNRLLSHGQRRQDQHVAERVVADMPRPFQLHRRFARTIPAEDRRPATSRAPSCHVALIVIEHRVDLIWRYVETDGIGDEALFGKEVYVVDHDDASLVID